MTDSHKRKDSNVQEESLATLTLSLPLQDKQDLKILAARKNMSASALVRQWIREHQTEQGGANDEI